jgi:hypothetical protein
LEQIAAVALDEVVVALGFPSLHTIATEHRELTIGVIPELVHVRPGRTHHRIQVPVLVLTIQPLARDTARGRPLPDQLIDVQRTPDIHP